MPRRPLDEGDTGPSAAAGYSRPPTQHQIRDGEVRNPWGRRGKPRPELDFLNETVTMTIDGKPRQITRSQALDYFLFAKAAKGHVPAIRHIEDRASQRQAGLPETVSTDLSAEDQAAFDRFILRNAERLGKDRT